MTVFEEDGLSAATPIMKIFFLMAIVTPLLQVAFIAFHPFAVLLQVETVSIFNRP